MKAFDNKKYLELQEKSIIERINKFDGKLYLEFGGKLFDDLHASRVLPGFRPTSKVELLAKMKDKSELIICIQADAIEKQKVRADVGITYDMEVLRMIDNLRGLGININSVVITRYDNQPSVDIFRKKLESHKIKTYVHTFTKGYPTDVDTIVSDAGYGANPYIKTTKPLVVVTAPGPGGGKLATCLSQMYHEYKKGNKVGYAKFETFPIWNLSLKHPVNVAYEAATADLKDVNMIDFFHLDAYGETTVNYNRDLEVFPVLKNILKKIIGTDLYKSPTDMGVNMVGFAITDDELVKKAARKEIIRRYYTAMFNYKSGIDSDDSSNRIKVLMDELNIKEDERKVISAARKKSRKERGVSVVAIELEDGRVITGKNNGLLTAPASMLLNAVKELCDIPDKVHLLSPTVLKPMVKLKKDLFGKNTLLNVEDILLGLAMGKSGSKLVGSVLNKLDNLKGLDAHSTHILGKKDEMMLRTLGIVFTSDYVYPDNNLYSNN